MKNIKKFKQFLALFVLLLVFTTSISAVAERIENDKYYITIGDFKAVASFAFLDTPALDDEIAAYRIWSYVGLDSQDKEVSASVVIDSYNNYYAANYKNAKRLYTATPMFNCHSYAWHNQNVSENVFWIDNPTNYYSGGGYVEVSTPREGDIICYFDDKGTSLAADDENLHSGIIVGFESTPKNGLAGEYIVQSKWGPSGLYNHNGYECPYTYYSQKFYSDDQYVQFANKVRFYRKKNDTHTHSYNYAENNEVYHLRVCTQCGYTKYEEHTWRSERSSSSLGGDSINYVPYSRCIYCDYRILSSMTW